MANYVENHLGKNETIVKMADRNGLFLVGTWIKGILLGVFIVPFIKAIIKTVQFLNVELAITNKRIIGKVGVANTKSLDAPLNKIQNSSVTQSFFGKIFNYATVRIDTAAGQFEFPAIKNAENFKSMLMNQIDQYEEDRVRQQATEMANAMSAALKQ